MIIFNRKQGHYSDRYGSICEMMTLNEIRYNPAASNFLLLVGLALKSPHTHSMLLRIESTGISFNCLLRHAEGDAEDLL